MSLFENGAVKRLMYSNNKNRGDERNNRNNRSQKNENNQQRKQQHNSGKAAVQKKRDLADRAQEILRRFDDTLTENERSFSDNNNQVQDQNMAPVDAVNDVLSAFNAAFQKNISKPSECRELIQETFGDVCAAMKYYYDPRFEICLPEMNATLDIMTTNHFASILLTILKQNFFEDDWDTMWKDVAFTLSLLLDTCAEKMKEDTISIYVTDILSSNGMWKTEINQLVEDIGITEDLATDLLISLPVRPEDMTDLMMRYTYKNFLWMLLDHADDNIEVLDRNAQRKLFDFFFDGKTINNKLGCKVIGRFLGDPEVSTLNDQVLEGAALLVYGEFKAMLYEKLETYDVHNIVFVLKYVMEQKKRNNNPTLFVAEEAAKYDTIRKAIMQIVQKDDTAKAYLV